MKTFHFGEVHLTPVVEIGRSFHPTTDMLPESTAEAIARHHDWLKPDFFDETTAPRRQRRARPAGALPAAGSCANAAGSASVPPSEAITPRGPGGG
jgi:hypothetical protein